MATQKKSDGRKPLRRKISPDNPLIIFQTNNRFGDSDEGFGKGDMYKEATRHGREVVRAFKEAVPDELKPYVYLEVNARLRDHYKRLEVMRRIFEPIEEAGIPCDFQVCDPHDIYTLDPERIERILTEFDCVRSICIAENDYEHYATFNVPRYAMSPYARYAIDAIEMAARHGRHIVFSEQTVKLMHVGADVLNQPMLETMRKYKEYIIPINEHLGPQHFARQTSVWGLWLSEVADQWGVEPQSWWFENARMIEPGVFGQSEPNNTRIMPPPLYRAMILQGAMMGATVFDFEPFWDLFDYDNSRCFREVIAPTLIEVIQRKLIPTKEQVMAKAKVAYQYELCKDINQFYDILKDVDYYHAEGYLARAAYGVYERFMEHEYIPNKDRNYFIPLLPPSTSKTVLDKFEKVIKQGECSSEEAYEALLRKYHTKRDGAGTASIMSMNGYTYVNQSHENLYELQTYSIDLPKPVRGITATRTDKGIELSWPADSGATTYHIHRAEGECIVRPVSADPYIWAAPKEELEDPEMFNVMSVYEDPAKANAKAAPPKANDVLPEIGQSKKAAFVDTTAKKNTTYTYTVTATTKTKERRDGTVNYLDYFVFSQSQSLAAEEITVPAKGEVVTRAIVEPEDPRPASQVWHPILTGAEGPHKRIALEIVQRLDEFKSAYDEANWRRITDLYSARYQDPNGFHREYVGRAWKWWFFRSNSFCYLRQIRQWFFDDYAETGEVRVHMFSLCRALRKDDRPFGSGYGGTIRIPRNKHEDVTFTWAKDTDGVWRIIHTDPALPCFEEMLWNSRGGDNKTAKLRPGIDD